MQRNGQLDHAEVRPEVSPSLGKDLDQFIADFLRKLRQILFAQRFDVGGRTDAVEEPLGRGWDPGWLRLLRKAWFRSWCLGARPACLPGFPGPAVARTPLLRGFPR